MVHRADHPLRFHRQDAVYFSTHEEADMDTHKLGEDGEEAMGHGAFNRTVLTRALQEASNFAPAIRWNTAR